MNETGKFTKRQEDGEKTVGHDEGQDHEKKEEESNEGDLKKLND